MSVNYKARVVAGYELASNWNEIIEEEFYEKNVNDFIFTSVYFDEPKYFGKIIKSADEGEGVEFIPTNIPFDSLHEFVNRYPEACKNKTIKFFLICQED